VPLALVLLLAAPASLDDDADYTKAVELYQEIELERSIERFESALAKEGLAPDERARCWAWIGLAHGQLARADDARRAFERAVAEDPEVRLPAAAPPQIEEMLEEARAAEKARRAAEAEKAAAEAAANEPPPAAPAPPPPAWVQYWPTVASAGTAGLGVVALGSAGVIAVLGLDKGMRQAWEVSYNDEANRLVDQMYTDLTLASAVTVVGLGALGAAVGFLFVPPVE
jgi:tetratricopeptide (TPR) repeat protein